MQEELSNQFKEIIYDTCREQIQEKVYYSDADAGEKLRVCFSKFYRLMMAQEEIVSAFLIQQELEQGNEN